LVLDQDSDWQTPEYPNKESLTVVSHSRVLLVSFLSSTIMLSTTSAPTLTPPRPGAPQGRTPAATLSPTSGATACPTRPPAARRSPSLSPPAPPPLDQSLARLVSSHSDTRESCTPHALQLTKPQLGVPLKLMLVVTM